MNTINYIEEFAKKAFSLFGLCVKCSYNESSSKEKGVSKNANGNMLTPDALDYRTRSTYRRNEFTTKSPG
jgi:hypothetical protein